ncbi:MAG TPA: DUF2726 domain-containing protein [Candidatus Angelobacter sp.]|nr:DUF2726 domain-containing protein [Candidatus Angelobacter sp.]
MEDRLRPLVNRGEGAVLDVARDVCKATGSEAFAKIRIADAIRIDGSGISNALYKYALSAHFDILVAKDNKAYLAIEFDGSGHDARNDALKASICDFFKLPLIRVKESHLDAKVFEDTAVGFFIWQLFCVDMFLADHEQDPYEIYDPLFYVRVQGKTRSWPFAYAQRWQGRLRRPFREAVPRFGENLDGKYRYGLLQFGSSLFTCVRGMEFRSIFVQMISDDRVVYGEAGISLDVHGLEARRLECFLNITTFVQGLAAAGMYTNAMHFLRGKNVAVPKDLMKARARALIQEGFRLKLASNFEY